MMFGDSPNITGIVHGGWSEGSASGAFFRSAMAANQEGGNAAQGDFGFDASRSSSMYGGSGTVQPASLRLMPCIRT